jgi:hypothetical protein
LLIFSCFVGFWVFNLGFFCVTFCEGGRTFNGTTAPLAHPPTSPNKDMRGEVFLFCGGDVSVNRLIRVGQGNWFISWWGCFCESLDKSGVGELVY